jgi:hypothetical protein
MERHLSYGSFYKLNLLRKDTYHREMKSAHSIDTNGDPTRLGGEPFLIQLCISMTRSVFGKGCSPVTISKHTTPKDQMSLG